MKFGIGLLGGVIGAIAGGGFWGAVVGAGIGIGISSMMEDKKRTSSSSRKSPRENLAASPLLCYLFTCFGKLAKADGRVTPDEAQYVSAFLKSMDLPSKEIRSQLIECFNEGRDSRTDFRCYATRLASELSRKDENLKREIFRVFCSLAVVDDTLNPAEESMLKILESALRIPGALDEFFTEDENERYRQSSRNRGGGTSASSSLQSSYEMLGITPDVTDIEVKKAFRKKVQEFHPDHVQGKGLSNEFIEIAKKKMQEINEAYDRICKSRKM